MIKAFIPARAGSKSIPNKNIIDLCGKPLIQWVIDAAKKSYYINEITVSTNSHEIAHTIKDQANVFWRSEETATDTASSESALIEYVRTCDRDDLIVFLQATSPLITSREIDEGIKSVLNKGFDSAISVVNMKRFYWDPVDGANYDITNRPRRQDYDGFLIENGAFYISYSEDILKTGVRVSGNISLVKCSELTFTEIDEPSDLSIVKALIRHHNLDEI